MLKFISIGQIAKRKRAKHCLAQLQWLALASMCVWMIGPLAADAVSIPPPVQKTQPDPRFMQYVLPAGSAFHVLLQTPLSTVVNQLGDPVEVITDHNLYVDEALILPKSTRLLGKIETLEPGIQGRDAILRVVFTRLDLKNGDQLPIQAHVRTERADHAWGGTLTQGTKPMLSVQRVAGIGEYNRVVFGGPRAMGKAIEITVGEPWIVILDAPVTLLLPEPDAF